MPVKTGYRPAPGSTTFRGKGGPMLATYAIADSPLGRLLMGATAAGIRAVSLGDADDVLLAGLEHSWPGVSWRRDAVGLAPMVDALLCHLRGALPEVTLPLDVSATPFQKRVWAALRHIPYGETRSYGAVANCVRRPGAARAVARACAANPVALLVPCHRVVREDGAPGGYRWGTTRKRRLLELERAGLRAAPMLAHVGTPG